MLKTDHTLDVVNGFASVRVDDLLPPLRLALLHEWSVPLAAAAVLEVRLHDCCTAVFQSHLPQHSLQVCAFASRSSVSPHDRHTHYSNTFVLTLRVLQQLE